MLSTLIGLERKAQGESGGGGGEGQERKMSVLIM